MTETTGSSPNPGEEAPRRPPPGRRGVLIAALSTVAVLLAAGMAVFAASRDDDSGPAASGQMAAAHEACEQWLDGDATARGHRPPAGWCDDMAGMMSGRRGGDHMMGGPGRVGPDAMGDTGRGMMGGGRSGWCDEMTRWMAQVGDDGNADG